MIIFGNFDFSTSGKPPGGGGLFYVRGTMQSCALVVPLTFFYCLSVRNTRAKFHVFITIYTIVTISRVSRLDNSDLSRKE